jgi:SAM-dependent methyltransferase
MNESPLGFPTASGTAAGTAAAGRLSLPPPPGWTQVPAWTGNGFALGDTVHRVLCYDVGSSGWTDELTGLHEDVDDEYHYMSIASREHAIGSLERWISVPEPVILDLGCSSGYTLKHLRERMPRAMVVGADYVRGPMEKLGAAIPDIPLLQFDLTKCPLPDGSIDGIVLLNILEHIEQDGTALGHVHRILRSGGIAVIEVPAGPGLYDLYDRRLLHFRRYRMRGLRRMASQAGFEVLESSHLGFFLYPAFWIAKKRNRFLQGASAAVKDAVIGRDMRRLGHSPVLTWLMRWENRLRQRVRYPVGIRCVMTCRKP